MLSKLFKYDFLFLQKGLVPYYFLTIIFAVIARCLSLIESSLFSIISSVFSGAAISMMISAVVTCVLRGWAGFRANLYKDESYLTHSLPVTKSVLYLSKTLSNLSCLLTSFVSIIAALFIRYYSKENLEFLKNFLNNAEQNFGIGVSEFLIGIIIVLFLEIIFVSFVGNFAIVTGQRANNGKIVKSLVIGLVTYFVSQILNIVVVVLAGQFDNNILKIITSNEINSYVLSELLWIFVAVYAVYCVAIYVIGNQALKNGVNVE